MDIDISVSETPEHRWGLYVSGLLLGDSKLRCDADHARQILRKALESGQEAETPGNPQDASREHIRNNLSASRRAFVYCGGCRMRLPNHEGVMNAHALAAHNGCAAFYPTPEVE